MKDKSNRLLQIKDLIRKHKIGSQEELLQILFSYGYDLTQATLSRDLKQLKVAKMPDHEGGYIYILPEDASGSKTINMRSSDGSRYTAQGFLSMDFCGAFAVIKTKPGYSGGVAADIDQYASAAVLGTIAGDDTILVIPRENISREDLTRALSEIIPNS
ncbi:MAG: ArgR family transcriptional regulator [Bacteroidales bacterium]|jgi:transcriptional regulator of arginine metabolism|nr:ArgR family transcriptional regulator [Bacteroidales bacterium]MDD3165825.1 ArgR family transcriptional regulator [Bacteroidales bacterium]MDD4771089.1 ArgR family transcriptional regulator [Bacteroidales bacterium]